MQPPAEALTIKLWTKAQALAQKHGININIKNFDGSYTLEREGKSMGIVASKIETIHAFLLGWDTAVTAADNYNRIN